MTDPRQLLSLAVVLFIPTYLILARQERALLAWICLTVSVQIFDTRMLVNLPAARAAGLLLIPQAIHFLPKILSTRPGKVLIFHYSYLIFLGIVFGFIFPWPDGGLERTLNQIAPGRSIIYLIRTGADISLAIFVARQVIKLKNPDKVLHYMLIGTSIAAFSGILEFLTRIDLYQLLTGIEYDYIPNRMRGFCYEPRGLGLITGIGSLLSLLLYSQQPSWKLFGLCCLHAMAFVLAGSTSALMAAGLGAMTLMLFNHKFRLYMLIFMTVGMIFLTLLFMTKSQFLATYIENARLRLTIERIERSPENIIENLAFRMDILDGPALLFLYSNPLYLLVGSGPGLVSLPATEYLPPSEDFNWAAETGINTPPSIGLVLELSNTGIIGLGLWLIIYICIFRAFNYLGKLNEPESRAWRIGKGAFAAVLGVYIMQVSPLSPNWAVFLGIGLAAYHTARSTPEQPKQVNVLKNYRHTNVGSDGLKPGELNGKSD